MTTPYNVQTDSGLRFVYAHPTLRDHGLPVAICLVYFALMSFVGGAYVLATYDNSDFYSRYVPDAYRISQGIFPEDTFVGPGYATLLMAMTGMTGDPLEAGKWIAGASAGLCGFLAFALFRRLFGYRAALLSLPIILVSGDFPAFAIEPSTDMPFLLLCIAVVLTLTNRAMSRTNRALLSGALGALAYLTRYNGVFLPVTCIVGILVLNALDEPIPQRIKAAAMHLLAFAAVASPWLYINYTHHGSPFYNTNYLNIATETYGFRSDWDGVTAVKQLFHGFGDVLMHDPKHFVSHYVLNLMESFRNSLTSKLAIVPVGLLACAGAALKLVQRPLNRDVSVVLLSIAMYFAIMAFGHWEDRYYFYVMVCYVGLASYFAVTFADWIADRLSFNRTIGFMVVAAAALLVFVASARDARKDVRLLLAMQPVELIAASDRLKEISPSGATIMARKPHLAYLSHNRGTFFPPVKSLDELKAAVSQSGADFLLYDKTSLGMRPDVAVLADPDNHIPWLAPVFSDRAKSLVVYRVLLSLPAGGTTRSESIQ